jgi:hypothetical protein
MRTERQIEASRANGARSRGPVTAEGKSNSSRNAIKHGLLAETIVLKTERGDRFLEVLAELEEELQPETSIEYTLIEKMAAARWRQLRLWGMEKSAMDQQIREEAEGEARREDIPTCGSMAFRSLGEARSIDLIIRYDSLCDRQYLRAHRRFMEMRRDRGESQKPPQPHPEVAPQPELAPVDLTPQPASDPFLPEPTQRKEEKQPNEPSNLLQTKQPPGANPAQSRQTYEVRSHSDFWLPTSSTPPSCKIDGSCHPLNPQDSR